MSDTLQRTKKTLSSMESIIHQEDNVNNNQLLVRRILSGKISLDNPKIKRGPQSVSECSQALWSAMAAAVRRRTWVTGKRYTQSQAIDRALILFLKEEREKYGE